MNLSLPVDAVAVVARTFHRSRGDTAVPHLAGLVSEVVEVVRDHRCGQVRLGVEQQRDLLSMLGVDGEVPCLLRGDPRRPQGNGNPSTLAHNAPLTRARAPIRLPGFAWLHALLSRRAARTTSHTDSPSQRAPPASPPS